MSPIAVAALIVFLEGMVVWAVVPVTHFYCEALGGGPQSVGLMFALMSLPKVITNPIFGRASDAFGRRPTLIVASLGALLASVGWATAPGLAWLAVSRALVGVFGGQLTLVQTVVADATPPERRAAGMGAIGGAFAASMVVGPLVGGFAAQWWGYAALGWVCATLQLGSLACITLLLPETRPNLTHDARSASWSAALTAPGVAALLGVTLFMMFGAAQFTTMFATFMDAAHGRGEQSLGVAFAALGLTGVVTQGLILRRAVRRAGERAVSVLGVLLMAASFLGLLYVATPSLVLAWVILLGVGSGLAMPTVKAMLSRRAGRDRQGLLLGTEQAVTALARGGGAAVAGGAFAVGGALGTFGLAAGCCLAAALLALLAGGARAELEQPLCGPADNPVEL